MQQCIQDSEFGKEQDAVCGWLYEWFRSDDPLLQRFVARFAPELAKRYMFHCLSTQQAEPVPGLEVSSFTIAVVSFGQILSDKLSAVSHGRPACVALFCCCSFATACHAIDARPVQETGCLPCLDCPHANFSRTAVVGSTAHAECKPAAATIHANCLLCCRVVYHRLLSRHHFVATHKAYTTYGHVLRMSVLLQACLVAIYEVKSSSTELHRLPDLTQPSVHHHPAVVRTGKVNSKSAYAPSTAGCCSILPSVACVPWSRVGYRLS